MASNVQELPMTAQSHSSSHPYVVVPCLLSAYQQIHTSLLRQIMRRSFFLFGVAVDERGVWCKASERVVARRQLVSCLFLDFGSEGQVNVESPTEGIHCESHVLKSPCVGSEEPSVYFVSLLLA